MAETTLSNGALPVRSMDEILAELDQRGQPEAVEVPCPELGSLFRVRGLTRAELMHMNTASTRKGVTNQAMLDEMSLTTGVVEPKITVEQYRRLRHRADANPAIQRLQTKIAELTSGEPIEGPDGEEVDVVDAIRRFPNLQWLEWAAFLRYRTEMEEAAMKKATAKRPGRRF